MEFLQVACKVRHPLSAPPSPLLSLERRRSSPLLVQSLDELQKIAETGVMCPPQVARTAVYSLNKSSTRDFIRRKAATFGFDGVVLAEMRVS